MWNWLFGKRKGEPASLLLSKSSATGVTPVSSLARVEESLEASEGCCPCCPGIEDSENKKRRQEAPRLGLDRRGRPVTPHACDLDHNPSSSALRLKSASSLSTVPARRPRVKNHKCEHGSSSTDPSGPQFEQFKSPTTPKYRPTVTPHHCFDDDSKLPRGDKDSHFWKWFVLALLLLGVAGATVGPRLLAGSKKKCIDRPKYC